MRVLRSLGWRRRAGSKKVPVRRALPAIPSPLPSAFDSGCLPDSSAPLQVSLLPSYPLSLKHRLCECCGASGGGASLSQIVSVCSGASRYPIPPSPLRSTPAVSRTPQHPHCSAFCFAPLLTFRTSPNLPGSERVVATSIVPRRTYDRGNLSLDFSLPATVRVAISPERSPPQARTTNLSAGVVACTDGTPSSRQSFMVGDRTYTHGTSRTQTY